jgi:hypothetical protein
MIPMMKKADEVGAVARPLHQQGVPQSSLFDLGDVDLQHEEGDGEGEHAVAERPQAVRGP